MWCLYKRLQISNHSRPHHHLFRAMWTLKEKSGLVLKILFCLTRNETSPWALTPGPLFYITLIRDANSVLERYSGHTLEYEIVNLKILQKCVILSKRSSLKMLMAQASLTMSSNLTGVISLDWSQSCSSFDSRTSLI